MKRYIPLATALIGLLGGAVYWLGALLWPASIAVALSMLATTLLSSRLPEAASDPKPAGFTSILNVVLLLLKYNALMALTAASLPFAAPANSALLLIMVCAYAAAGGMAVSLQITSVDLAIALALGLLPAALLGIPGLVGLVAAILSRVAFGAYLKRERTATVGTGFFAAQQLAETCFYLGAVAAWSLV
jgi:adenosylcobinamide-GDP ribazoletransferase